MSKLKLQSLISAILVYVIILSVIFFAIFFKPSMPKAKVYTEKKNNSNIIEVSLASSSDIDRQLALLKQKKQLKKNIVKTKPKKKKKVVKKVRNIHNKSTKHTKKSVKKKKIIKKKTITKKTTKPVPKKVTKSVKSSSKKNTHKVSKPNTNKLFGSIDKNLLKTPSINKKGTSNSKNRNIKNNGIVNKYMAKVQKTLQGWPAQSNFAGEKIRVELTVYSTGLFDYKILYKSLNPEFNASLKSYLEQLRRFGFGPHNNPKPYKIIVEFIAK